MPPLTTNHMRTVPSFNLDASLPERSQVAKILASLVGLIIVALLVNALMAYVTHLEYRIATANVRSPRG